MGSGCQNVADSTTLGGHNFTVLSKLSTKDMHYKMNADIIYQWKPHIKLILLIDQKEVLLNTKANLGPELC